MLVDQVLSDLSALPASTSRDAFCTFVRSSGKRVLLRDGTAEHLTASCFVFSPDLAQVLLCFHRKGQFWVQFGGHLEPHDASLADAALREGREESGVQDLELIGDDIVDLDRHDLHAGFACAAHWDVGFASIAAPDAAVAVSQESESVSWFPVADLPTTVPPRFGIRLAQVRDSVASRRARAGDDPH